MKKIKVNWRFFLAAIVVIGVMGYIFYTEFRLGGLDNSEFWLVISPGFIIAIVALMMAFKTVKFPEEKAEIKITHITKP